MSLLEEMIDHMSDLEPGQVRLGSGLIYSPPLGRVMPTTEDPDLIAMARAAYCDGRIEIERFEMLVGRALSGAVLTRDGMSADIQMREMQP
jgi:hypothetical protein